MLRSLRVLLVLLVLGVPALAEGLVLPFAGDGGHSLASVLADELNAPMPALAALMLPNLPWRGSYDASAGGLQTQGGATLAREVTGADWLVTGRMQNGWIEVYFSSAKASRKARFSRHELVGPWVGLQLGQRAGLLPPLDLSQEEALARITEGDLSLVRSSALGGLLSSALGLVDEGVPASPELKAMLPKLTAFWENAAQEQFPPAYLAFFQYGQNRGAALAALPKLAEGLIYERLTAILLWRDAGDARWREVARKTAPLAPEVVALWEDLSFAAFDDNNPNEALQALLQANRLNPSSGLYWINLGWAYYLLGDKARSAAASLQGVRRDDSPVPAYNLGLVYALYGDSTNARRAYDQAISRDDRNEVDAALKDLRDTNNSQMLYWQGYLLEKTGDLAAAQNAYRQFIALHPQSVLAGRAQKSLELRLQTRLSLGVLSLSPEGPDARPFGAGETVFPEVSLEGFPYLPKGQLVTTLYNASGQVVQKREKAVAGGAGVAGLQENAAGVVLPAAGQYRLEVQFGDSKASIELQVGQPSLARQLFSVGLQPVALSGAPLLSERDLLSANGEALLLERIVNELRQVAPRAKTIPQLNQALAQGPFKGQSIADVMEKVEASTVRAFLQAAIEDPALIGDSDVVNAFIDWVDRQQ